MSPSHLGSWTRMRRRRRAAGCAAFALFAVGCGGVDDAEVESAPAVPSEPSDPAVTAAPLTSSGATTPDSTSPTTVPAIDTTSPSTEAPASTDQATTTEPVCDTSLTFGCEGARVAELQRLLTSGGFGDLDDDGIFGPATQAALERFESDCGACTTDTRIEPDGEEWDELAGAEPADVEFASAFDAWVGGGDPENACRWVADIEGLPLGPTFGFGFDLERLDSGVELFAALRYEMCFVGFDPARPIRFDVERDSSITSAEISAGPAATTDVNGLLGGAAASATMEYVEPSFGNPGFLLSTWDRLDDPTLVGSYVLTASQGDVAVTRTVEVRAGDYGDPGLRVITADDPLTWFEVGPGDTLTAVLAGFEPNSTVPLALYRQTDRNTDLGPIFEFVQPMGSATIGDQGWAYHQFIAPDVELPSDFGGLCLATVESLRSLYCQPYVDAYYYPAR